MSDQIKKGAHAIHLGLIEMLIVKKWKVIKY